MSRNPLWHGLNSLNWVIRRAPRFALTVIRFPGVAQLVCLAILYRYAHIRWCDKYCGTWDPAFPKAWTAWFLTLAVIPVFALLQLLWLTGSELIVWLVTKSGRGRYSYAGVGNGNGNGNGRTIFSDDEERADYMLLQQVESEHGPQAPDEPLSTSRMHKIRTLTNSIPSFSKTLWWSQIALYTILVFVGWREYTNYESEDDTRWKPALKNALAHHDRDPAGYAKGEQIYFAAAFYNNQDVLPYWTKTLLDVIAYYGPDNVYVSIVENNSDDRTPELLRDLETALARLNVRRRILIQDEGVQRPPDMAWNNRIDFLSAIRNRALQPLVEHGGFDKVVFSNDIFIEPESLIELIETNNGEYDMSCAMDFGHFGAYDMWVLRDRVGHLTAGIWPYFFDAADYEAVKSGSPVPVLTCWNGIAVFQADPLLPIHLRANRTLSTSPLPRPPPSTHPLANSLGESPALTPPLVFRSSPRGEGCFSSESFLLPYDMRRIMGMDRIYVNPRVITAYAWHFYVWYKWILRHRLVRWFVEEVYDGAWMQYARMIVGDDEKVYTWDGGDCYPWWYGDWW